MQRKGGHHVFCPADPRWMVREDDTWEPADREPDVGLSPGTKAVLDELGPLLLERWRAAGANPWTLRQITEALGELGWTGATTRGAWLQIRTWLRGWSAVLRVGRDYWLMAQCLPEEPKRSRLRVAAVFPPAADATSAISPGQESDAEPAGSNRAAPDRGASNADLLKIPETLGPVVTHWTVAIRTVNLLEGFLPIPASARAAYPPCSPGSSRWEAVRGKWSESNRDLWIWLDREHDRLCGPDLAEELARCEAGQRLRITWATDALVLQAEGTDAEVQREETRLVDLETLSQLRGGLGESYRATIQAILNRSSQTGKSANLRTY